MSNFRLFNILVILFLSTGIFMASCSKDDDSAPVKEAPKNEGEGNNPPVDTTDTAPVVDSLNYFSFTVSGAIDAQVEGTPQIILQDNSASSFIFLTEGADVSFRFNRNHYGIPIDFLDPEDTEITGGGWTLTPGTYEVFREGWNNDGVPTYYSIVFDNINNQKFGGPEDFDSNGSITISEVGYDAEGYGYVIGTFLFEAFKDNEKVTVNGEFRIALIA